MGSYKPDGYTSVSPYLIVDGASATIDFLRRVFAAVEIRRFADPAGKVMHAEVRIDDTVVMIADGVGRMAAGAVSRPCLRARRRRDLQARARGGRNVGAGAGQERRCRQAWRREGCRRHDVVDRHEDRSERGVAPRTDRGGARSASAGCPCLDTGARRSSRAAARLSRRVCSGRVPPDWRPSGFTCSTSPAWSIGCSPMLAASRCLTSSGRRSRRKGLRRSPAVVDDLPRCIRRTGGSRAGSAACDTPQHTDRNAAGRTSAAACDGAGTAVSCGRAYAAPCRTDAGDRPGAAVIRVLAALAVLLAPVRRSRTARRRAPPRGARARWNRDRCSRTPTVVVSGSDITAIESSGSTPADIDLGQSTLLPGLIDVHVAHRLALRIERALRASRVDAVAGHSLRCGERVPHVDGRVHDGSEPRATGRRRAAGRDRARRASRTAHSDVDSCRSRR